MQVRSIKHGNSMRFNEPKLETAKHPRELLNYEHEIETDEQRVVFNVAMDATNQVINTDGFKIREFLSHLHRSDVIVEHNYETLTDVFDRSRDLSECSWDDIQALDLEFLAEFSNFVISSKSRENMTRDIVLPRLEQLHVVSSITEEYESKVKELNVDLHGYFFTSLRNYLVHEGVPETVIVLGKLEDEEEHTQLTIRKEILAGSDNFTVRARGYMDAWEEEINVEEASESYYEATNELYDWFFDYVNETYEDEFEKSQRLDEHARILQEVFFNSIDQSFMTIQWK